MKTHALRSRQAAFALVAAVMLAVALRSTTTLSAAISPVVPETVSYASGTLTLRGLLYRPATTGRHRAILFLHGSGDNYDSQAAAVGALYSSHGYLLFLPFRRGQGLSAGQGESITARLDREALTGGMPRAELMAKLLQTEQLDDVRAAMSYLRARSDVDTTRIAVAGNSFGGILTMFAAAWVPGIRAAVPSAPAAQTWAAAPALRELLFAAAKEAKVPVYFFQAENDYNLAPSRELSAAMLAAGHASRMKIYPAFGKTTADGHSFGYFGGATYGDDVFGFLDESFAKR